MNGLTIAAVTKGSGSVASANNAAQAMLFGLGLFEIN